ncbi:hypothetical protein [Mucilaginibacter lacusdianchii]|uniref:hypothetical protein n=1 Tax=Mucilaginibacter lacusdianchii TaxID=2684211 RepID=UPI00131AF424|nr:hypothetical protein [Mucilaginibacter sp. JXJ CY 39]
MKTAQSLSISAIEKLFLKLGKIVAVRSWNGGHIHEVDVHLPNVNFDTWGKAQSKNAGYRLRITPIIHLPCGTPKKNLQALY